MKEKIKNINPYLLAMMTVFVGALILAISFGIYVFSMQVFANNTDDAFNDKFIVNEKPDLSLQRQFYSDDISKQIQKEIEMIEKQMQSNQSMFPSMHQSLMVGRLNNTSLIPQVSANANNKIIVQELDDKYVVTIDRQGKTIEEEININVEPNKIDIQLKENINKGNYRASSSIMKSLAFSNPVDASKVIRSNKGDKHIVTIPKL